MTYGERGTATPRCVSGARDPVRVQQRPAAATRGPSRSRDLDVTDQRPTAHASATPAPAPSRPAPHTVQCVDQRLPLRRQRRRRRQLLDPRPQRPRRPEAGRDRALRRAAGPERRCSRAAPATTGTFDGTLGWTPARGGAAAFDVCVPLSRCRSRHRRARHAAGRQRLHPPQLDAPERRRLLRRRAPSVAHSSVAARPWRTTPTTATRCGVQPRRPSFQDRYSPDLTAAAARTDGTVGASSRPLMRSAPSRSRRRATPPDRRSWLLVRRPPADGFVAQRWSAPTCAARVRCGQRQGPVDASSGLGRLLAHVVIAAAGRPRRDQPRLHRRRRPGIESSRYEPAAGRPPRAGVWETPRP